jgi:hypothetical protein
MTICTKCKLKIKGKTAYHKLKPDSSKNSPVCSDCFVKLRNRYKFTKLPVRRPAWLDMFIKQEKARVNGSNEQYEAFRSNS